MHFKTQQLRVCRNDQQPLLLERNVKQIAIRVDFSFAVL